MRIARLRAKLEIGDYGGIDLEEWIKQIDDRLDWLTSHLADVEDTIEKIKRIVPLVDDDELGMHEADVPVEFITEGRNANGN